MKFVDIGEHSVNLELVTHIDWKATCEFFSKAEYYVAVYLAGGNVFYLSIGEDDKAIAQLRAALSGAIVRDGEEAKPNKIKSAKGYMHPTEGWQSS